jgi:hypothetical protein
MKKLVSIAALCVAVFLTSVTVSASNPIYGGQKLSSQKVSNQRFLNTTSNSRAGGCDTLTNLSIADSSQYYYPMDTAAAAIAQGAIDGIGYLDGNGAIAAPGGTMYSMLNIAERFTAPAGASNQYVTSAVMFFSYVNLRANSADSAIQVTAYVYDTTGVGLGGYGPGQAIDSASVSLGFIGTHYGAEFVFTHQARLLSKGFFIGLKLPQTPGDTIAVALNDGTTGNGNGWFRAGVGSIGQWIPYDSLAHFAIGSFTFPVVCGTACPTITTTATQQGASSASASASGGQGPYSYSWSNGQTTNPATGLTAGQTYTVTATDHNGCTGNATLRLTTGINDLNGLSSFSIYPNPSNGIFSASAKLENTSDITISIADITGSKVYEITDKAVKEMTKSIDLSNISAGIYIVNVKTDRGTATQRIAIK